MPFLLAEILNFQGSTHRIGVGSFSKFIKVEMFTLLHHMHDKGMLQLQPGCIYYPVQNGCHLYLL